MKVNKISAHTLFAKYACATLERALRSLDMTRETKTEKKILQPLLGIFLSLSSQFFFTGKAHNNISSRDKDVNSRDKALPEAKTSIFFPVFL